MLRHSLGRSSGCVPTSLELIPTRATHDARSRVRAPPVPGAGGRRRGSGCRGTRRSTPGRRRNRRGQPGGRSRARQPEGRRGCSERQASWTGSRHPPIQRSGAIQRNSRLSERAMAPEWPGADHQPGIRITTSAPVHGLWSPDGHRILLDAGVHPRRDVSSPDCASIPAGPGEVEAVVISHCHHDHVGSAGRPGHFSARQRADDRSQLLPGRARPSQLP